MTDNWCVLPGGLGEYQLGRYPNAERECLNQGGRIEDRGGLLSGLCSSTNAVVTDPNNPSGGYGTEAYFTEAGLLPLRIFRDLAARSDIVRDLVVVNSSPEVAQLIADDPSVRDDVREVVGLASQYALSAMVRHLGSVIDEIVFTDSAAEQLIRLARRVADRVGDDEVQAALARLQEAAEARAGRTVGELFSEVQDQSLDTAF